MGKGLNAMSPEARRVELQDFHSLEGGWLTRCEWDKEDMDNYLAQLKAADERAGELRALRWVQGYMVSRGIGGMSTALEHRIYELEKEATNG